MKKLVMLALTILPLLFIANTKIAGKAGSSQPWPSSPTQNKLSGPSRPAMVNKGAIMAKALSLAVPFVKNVGQFDAAVKYAADLFAGRFFLTGNELVYSLVKREGKKAVRPDRLRQQVEPEQKVPGKGLAFRECFIDKKGLKIDFKISGKQQATTKVSYFKGNDASKWRSNVPSYQSVSLGEVYPGIEVKLKASGKNVEKIFYVSPQGNVADIKIGVAGVAGFKIDKDGRLIFKNSLGELAMRAPIAWQEIAGERYEVKTGYRLLGGNVYGFSAPVNYDREYPLVIDPELDTLLASMRLGGTYQDEITSMCLDDSGYVYVCGFTSSSDFPTVPGAFNETKAGMTDAFVAKLSKDLSALMSSTLLGGSNGDMAIGIKLDDLLNVYLWGSTLSADFPTTPEAFDQTHEEGNPHLDAFLCKLNNDLTGLLGSTFLGGSGYEYCSALSVDHSGDVFVCGKTCSPDFPTSEGAYDRHYDWTYPYDGDAFISRLDGNLTVLRSSTFLGGSLTDGINALALDGTGNVFVIGETISKDFPTSEGAFRTVSPSDSYNVFVTKTDGMLGKILASTYLGGNTYTFKNSIALSGSGDVYICGDSPWGASLPFPSGNPFFGTNGYSAAFVCKFNGDLSKLFAGAYLGGRMFEFGCQLALDPAGDVYLSGFTNSDDFPTTVGAYDRSYIGGKIEESYQYQNAYIAKLDSSLTFLLGSTFFGGSGVDKANIGSIAADGLGNIFLVGGSSQDDFPVTSGTYTSPAGGNEDCFICRLGSGSTRLTVTSPDGGEVWVQGDAHDITWWRADNTSPFVRIEVSSDRGSSWSDVTASTENSGKYHWTIPDIPSLNCLVRVSDAAQPAVMDTSNSVFAILMHLELQAERHELRSFSILRHIGKICFQAGNPSVDVERYKLLRRKSSSDYDFFRNVLPSELKNNQFEIEDRYLEKNLKYTYRVEAFNAEGKLVGYSDEKTI